MFKKGLGFVTALMIIVSVFGTDVQGTVFLNQPTKKAASVEGSDREREKANRTSENDRVAKQVNPFKAKGINKNTSDPNSKITKPSDIVLKVSNNLVSMTESRIIEVEADFHYVPDLNNLTWTFGELPFSDWKKWNSKVKAYTGEPFISFAEIPTVIGTTVKAKVKFDLIYGTTNLSTRSIRVLYPALIDYYELAVKDSFTGSIASSEMKLNVYDSYHTYDELKPALDEIFARAKKGRYLEYQVIGQSQEGRDFHFVILAKDRASVNKYLMNTVPMMLNNPEELLKLLSSNKLGDYKVPIFLNNIHPDEAPGIDAQIDALRLFATKDNIQYKTLDKNNKEVTVDLNVDKLLDNVILLMNLTENPDGRNYNTRQNANGFDVNRDNGYQTQIESQILTQQIAKWNPITFLDLHGFVSGFLLEPCTPPHDPNYEYDLLINNMLEQAEVMGKAGISNTKYNSYVIPYNDYGYGWDDGAPAYTATYAMHHGALGHTIEMPELNQDSNNAVVYTILASANYVLENKDTLFKSQLEYFKRGVNGIDSKEVDKWLVNAAGVSVGRQRINGENFFPEYYILPVEKSLQKNQLEVYKMVQYLLRNGIMVDKTIGTVTIDGVSYPAGTYIVNMHQAKRGLANTALYCGYDASDFKEMYAEIVMNFPVLRGFDVYKTYKKNAFALKTIDVKNISIPSTQYKANYEQYVIRNINNDAVKAVNKLLSQGKPVSVALNGGKNYDAGDYIISMTDFQQISKDYLLEVAEYDGAVKSKKLVQPKISAAGSKESKYVLQQLGFKVVESIKDSNVIVDDYGYGDVKAVKEGKAYIGLGAYALDLVKEKKLLEGFDYGVIGDYYEGLLKSEISKDNLITSGYSNNESLYVIDGSFIKAVPSSSKILAKVTSYEDFFEAGWMPGHDTIKGKVLAITDNSQGYRITLFANTLTNKAHPQSSFRLLANSIFMSTSDLDK